MKRSLDIILILLLLFPVLASAQYLSNPSFEGGPSGIALTPPDWSPFYHQSTPDTEPLACDDFTASDGDTYVTLVAHGSLSSTPNIPENCQTQLTQPLVAGSCYTLSMDLASRDDLGHYAWGEGFIHYRATVNLKVFGSSISSEKGVLLAEIGPVTNVNWENSSFIIKPKIEVNYLLLEVAFEDAGALNGNILVDNMILSYLAPDANIMLDETFSTADLPIIIEASESYSYTWSPNTGLSCYDCRSPQVNSNNSRTYTCSVTSSSNGCPANELFILTFEDNPVLPGDFKIPNVFTPNGDGTNDRFVISGLPPNSALLVYDRSGLKLYSSDAYNNEWDGSDMDGNPLPEDTYWYVLTTQGQNGNHKGPVYLKRN
ncbi:MAG: gliding motility-associated C-terminal domain-containing protein [Bacteroidetes bacterium]|nr:gliding motility-associated C-terminal domain-containing protein [Bacteroidota bacterium]